MLTTCCRNHEIYQQYTQMIEQLLEKFMAKEGLSAQV